MELASPLVSSPSSLLAHPPPLGTTQEAEEMNLPRLAQRGRRKSKDLEEQAMDLMATVWMGWRMTWTR